jgi:hypothetical protein
MDFLKESDSILLRYAPLENSCSAAFVELSVDYREGLGASHDLSTMDAFVELSVDYRESPRSVPIDEVRPRQYPCSRAFDLGN